MATATSCPDPTRLQALIAGALSDEDQAALAGHLDTCEVCQRTLESLAAGSQAWVVQAGQVTADAAEAGPALQEAMCELKAEAVGASTAGPPVDDNLDFLTPTDKPGCLGLLAHYEVVSILGRGGFGVVLKAFDPVLHRFVAVKVLSPQLATNASARKRFSREARAAAAVSHEHVVAIHQVDEFNSLPYLVMQYISGFSLQERLDKTGPLQVEEILRIGMQIASGLSAAHAQGLVHRDIKPANILLENGVERVKITDFGLARAVDDASLTQSGVIAGTPQYMAPEQARGEMVDHRADLFSLGSVLYALCTGHAPFRASNTPAVLRRVTDEMPRPIREINPDIPDWLAAIVEKLQAKESKDRFQSSKEVAELLGQHLAHLQQPDVVPRPASPSGGRSETQATGFTAAVGRWLLLAVFGVLLAIASVVLLAIYTPWRSPEPWEHNTGSYVGAALGMLSAIIIPVVAWRMGSLFEPRRVAGAEHSEAPVDGRRGFKDSAPATQPTLGTRALREGAISCVMVMIGMGLGIANWLLPTGPSILLSLTSVALLVSAVTIMIPAAIARHRLRRQIGTLALEGRPQDAVPPPMPWSARFLRFVAISVVIAVVPFLHLISRGTAAHFWTMGGLGSLLTLCLIVYLYQLAKQRRQTGRPTPGRDLFDATMLVLLILGTFALFASTGELASWLTGKAVLQIETQPDALVKYQNDVKVSVFRKGKKVAEIAAGDWMSLDPDWYQLFPEGCFQHYQGVNWVMEIEPLRAGLGPGKKQVARIFVRPKREGDAVAVIQKPAGKDAGFVPLFNGKDLTGWISQPADSGSWKVEKGVLVGSGAKSFLVCERGDFQDFHLRLEGRISLEGDSGLYFRCQPDADLPRGVRSGYEAQIISGTGVQTGSLFKFVEGQTQDLRLLAVDRTPHDTWFTQEVIVEGKHITIKVNGVQVVDYVDDEQAVLKGQLALDIYRAGSKVEFRKIEIKELPSAAVRVARDREQLQGTWHAVSLAGGGTAVAGEAAWQYSIVFTGDQVRWTLPGNRLVEGTFTLDPSQEQLTIDRGDPKKPPLNGNYVFKDGRLEFTRFHDPTDALYKAGVSIKFERSPAADGFVPLFNGKDLTGWMMHAAQPKGWKVEDELLVGSGYRSHLFTERGNYANFHLRAEVRINDGGNSGVYFRVPAIGLPRLNVFPLGFEAQINSTGKDPVKTGSLWRTLESDVGIVPARKPPPKAGEWFTLEVIADQASITVKFNGDITAEFVEAKREYLQGHLALQCHDPQTVVEFRKIEIKELPGPRLPDSAEQVLPALAGAWKGEYTQKIYGGKPAEKKISAVAVNDWILGQKWLRQRVQLENEGFQSVTTYEPNSKTFRDWFFHSRGLIFGPTTGRWDAATRTVTWTSLPQDGVILLMTLRFVDANTVAGESLIRDKEGNTVFEMASLMKRTTENVAIDETTSAGPLPPEMAVLDRHVGDWQVTGVLTDAKNPSGLKAGWQNSVRKILGGRFIATQAFGNPRDKETYSLFTFDTFSKAYGRWLFKSDGSVLEYGGGWDEKAQTMKWHWAAKDGSQSTNTWQFRDANRIEWLILTKDALGKTTLEFQATSIRQSEPGWVPLFNGKDLTGWKYHDELPGEWKVERDPRQRRDSTPYSERRDFESFHLRAEFKINRGGDSGIFFRADPEKLRIVLDGRERPGYEAQISGDPRTAYHTGSLLNLVPDHRFREQLVKPDEWGTMEIMANENHLTIKVNGATTVDMTHTGHTKGAFALQQFRPDSIIQFRKIEIKELPTEPGIRHSATGDKSSQTLIE